MFAALMRHEARLQLRPLAVITGIAALVVALAAVFTLLDVEVLHGFGVVIGIVALIAYPLAVFALLVVSYYRSMYGSHGYFTMSLPVDGKVLYWAKFLWAWLVSLAATAISIGFKLFQMWIDDVRDRGRRGDAAVSSLGELGRMVADRGAVVAVVGAGVVLLLAAYVAILGFVVTAGSGPRLNRLGAGGPAVMGALTYVAMQLALLVSILAIPLGLRLDGEGIAIVHHSFVTDLTNRTSTSLLPVGWVPALVLIGAGLAVWTVNAVRHHTSLR